MHNFVSPPDDHEWVTFMMDGYDHLLAGIWVRKNDWILLPTAIPDTYLIYSCQGNPLEGEFYITPAPIGYTVAHMVSDDEAKRMIAENN